LGDLELKGNKALILSVLFGLMAAIAAYFYIYQYKKILFGGYEQQPVVVASQNILANAPVVSSMVELRMVPKPFIQPKAIQSLEAVEGYIATANIFAGEQILDTKLSKPSERAVSLLIPRDKRAFTIAINEITGVAGLIRPGDHVDIIGTFQTSDKTTRLVAKSLTITFMQNVEVLSVGRNYALESMYNSSGSRSSIPNDLTGASSNKKTQFSNITLSVTPRESMDLALAQQIGVLSLALRSYYDRPGKEITGLKNDPSSAASVTGIEDPIRMSPVPKWLELRGENAVMVP
jgi:pilus assembly protein CpaB